MYFCLLSEHGYVVMCYLFKPYYFFVILTFFTITLRFSKHVSLVYNVLICTHLMKEMKKFHIIELIGHILLRHITHEI